MNQTTSRMKRTATFFLTARLHALCVAACRRLLAQAGLASGAAVGCHMPAMETLHRHHVAIRFHWAAVKPSDVEAQRGFRVTRPLPTILTLAREATIAPDLLKQALAEGRRRGLIRLSEMTQARADASPPAWFAALLKKHCA